MLRVEVTVPMDIPDVEVIRTKITKASVLIITLESTKKGTTYQRCGR
ncbi:MAG: hypothetical protein ANABAC_3656 [Anaerolineae bacterium]|jgi:hypothetical protein|nr:MAG: hypothetical protein ANABAC_3656 [Anaerolineae bacterium]